MTWLERDVWAGKLLIVPCCPLERQWSNEWRFGTFEVDFRARELRKGGIRIRLQDQPLRDLTVMLDRPGEVVTREELRQLLWSAGTFVDFEHSLNAAIKRLRARSATMPITPVLSSRCIAVGIASSPPSNPPSFRRAVFSVHPRPCQLAG